MLTKTFILSAASTFALATAAYAADNNTVYLEQIGAGNSASIKQFRNDGGNDIGLLSDPVSQTGDNNTFNYSNDFCCNSGGGDNDIVKAEQDGDDNYFSSADGNRSRGNRITLALQTGDDNSMEISHNGADDSTVSSATQLGDMNFMRIVQSSLAGGAGDSNNLVVSAAMTGSNNGISRNTGSFTGSGLGMYIRQTGEDNTINSASIEGSNNNVSRTTVLMSSFGTLPMYLRQIGLRNTMSADMVGSNGNYMWVWQDGNDNTADFDQGSSIASTGNAADVYQNGDGNAATGSQLGSANTLRAIFNGNGNGVGVMSGNAGSLVASSASLTLGNMLQDASAALSGNSLDYEVSGNDNLFAFAQIGGGNTISGTVGAGGTSNSNQVAVLQNGSGNTASFAQAGAGTNNIAISQ